MSNSDWYVEKPKMTWEEWRDYLISKGYTKEYAEEKARSVYLKQHNRLPLQKEVSTA